MPSSPPSLPELREVCQPPELVGRRSGEHWAGRLYMRQLSLPVTRRLVSTRVTPNGLTLAMIAAGLIAALVATVPSVWAAFLAFLLIQTYLLLDCVDGEVARWRGTTSAAGVYLDRLGHHVVEATLVLGIGIRAGGGDVRTAGGWATIGAVTALLVVIGKVETDLVTVARVGARLPDDPERDPTSRVSSVRRLRSVFRLLPLHRLVGAIELSGLLLIAAIVDALLGELTATRVLLLATGGMAAVVAVGHPITILSSERLR
jgi:hypothetical protein